MKIKYIRIENWYVDGSFLILHGEVQLFSQVQSDTVFLWVDFNGWQLPEENGTAGSNIKSLKACNLCWNVWFALTCPVFVPCMTGQRLQSKTIEGHVSTRRPWNAPQMLGILCNHGNVQWLKKEKVFLAWNTPPKLLWLYFYIKILYQSNLSLLVIFT